jgi:NAD+ kinase
MVVSRRAPAVAYASRLAAAAGAHGLACEWLSEGDHVDCVVAVGGDGTVLEAARGALALDVPIIGFNLGTIGFLAEVEPEDLDWALARLAAGHFRVEPRSTLHAEIEGIDEAGAIGVNDVVVEKIESQRLVVLAVEVNGEEFLTHRADGVVVATSTGSSAYAFSAGGPLVDPAIEALLVVPVAPHSLFNRTLVLPPDVSIRVTVVADRPVRVSVDGGEIGEVDEGGSVAITRGPKPIRFVRFDTEGFAAKVTRKFELR